MSEETAQNMQELLRGCVLEGSARNALFSNFKISGKTGTSQEHRDAWFVGFSDRYIVGVWLGNDDYSPMKRVWGGGQPTMIARDVLRALG